MGKKEMVAMLLAGGQGSRLGVLTANRAKPDVSFGGKYRIIDFPLSNCINSGIDTVGVLTQYMPYSLTRHIGIGVPWDLDSVRGGVSILGPHVKEADEGSWYSGTANAIYQNIDYLDSYNPSYVLILSGDHIYKMNYSKMLAQHKKSSSDVSIAVLEVPMEEACRFGIMNVEENSNRIYEFEEKPQNPKSNLASMGIYIFTWSVLRETLINENLLHPDLDFGKHIIPSLLEKGYNLDAYKYEGYWKDVGTIESYWASNMELIKTVPDFNLYEDFWKIYTKSFSQAPQIIGETGEANNSLISDGCDIFGAVHSSILGQEVVVEEGAYVKDSIILHKSVIKKGAKLDRCIVDNNCIIGENVSIGEFENIPNYKKPQIYNTGITVIAQDSQIPNGVKIGKNCVIIGDTKIEDYENCVLDSGKTINKCSVSEVL